MKIGEKVKYRSNSLEVKRLLDCGVHPDLAKPIFDGAIGVVVKIQKIGNYSALDIVIKFDIPFGEPITAPANFFITIQEVKKGHHLTNMFRFDDIKVRV